MTATRGASASRLAWPLAALSLFGLGVTGLLSFSTLWETPDTNCGQLFNPTGGICEAITDRRATWVMWTAGLTVVVIVLTVLAFRARRSGTPWISAALLVLALGAGGYGAWLLINGSDADLCGSTLSRLEPMNSAPGAYFACDQVFADDRRDATIAGGVAAVAFLAALGASLRNVTSAPDRLARRG